MEEELEERPRSPLWIILAVFLLLLVVFMAIPYYGVTVGITPSQIPSIDDVVPRNFDVPERNVTLLGERDYLTMLEPTDFIVKQTADRVASYSCGNNKICQAKAMFYFVRDNFNYVSDPTSFDYVKTARESLAVRGGDCDDASVLLANLLSAVGIPARFVFVPGHVYVQGLIEDKWYNMDATCMSCDFGEISYSYSEKEKTIIG